MRPDQRQPLWQQRLKSQQLLAVARDFPAFPIIMETYRSCLQDVFDLPALVELLGGIQRREIRVDVVETPSPSPFARSLVFAYVAAYLYEGDAPLAERKAQALALDRQLLRELLGHEELRELLDAAVIDAVEAEQQGLAPERRAKHPDGLHDLLRRVGDLSEDELHDRCTEDPTAWLQQLERSRRAIPLRVAGDPRWIAIEDAGRYRDALGCLPPPGLPTAFLEAVPDALDGRQLGDARFCRPTQVAKRHDQRLASLRAQPRHLIERVKAEGESRVAQLLGHDRSRGVGGIVSSLPLRSLPPAVTRAIGHQFETLLDAGGLLVQYTYDLRGTQSGLLPHFRRRSSKIIWSNLPPARVEVFERE